MDKAINTLVDLVQGKEVDMSIKRSPGRVLEHPTPTTYIWYMGHNEHMEMKRAYNLNRGMQKPKELVPAYAGVRK